MTTTLNRALARVDADALDAAVGVFVQAHTADPLAGAAGDPPVLQPAADGKTVRGARDSEGLQLHLLGVYQVAPGVMLAQREMRHKPHETVHLSTVLSAQLDALDWARPPIRTSPCTAPRRPTKAATRSASCACSPSRRGR
ncbi:hypothetical protein AB0J25_22320 [Streptomyces sp. NPDC049910]|uniref:hypothetical protein n=1 Tax=Streptomyces sp. NPDC049910 TaxID=3155278 RepID=UPI00342DA09A